MFAKNCARNQLLPGKLGPCHSFFLKINTLKYRPYTFLAFELEFDKSNKMARKSSKAAIPPTIGADTFKVKKSELNALMKLRGVEASTALHDDFNGVLGLCESLHTSPKTGLVDTEADLEERRKIFGWNVIPPKRIKTIFELAWEAFQDLTLIVLTVASIISFGLSFYPEAPSLEAEEQRTSEIKWLDGVAIMLAVVIVVTVTAFNDWRKGRQFRGLKQQLENEQKISTLRNGSVKQHLVSELVVGDICYIKYGDLIPADGVLVHGSDLRVDESSLTGESDLIKKNDDNRLLLSGTRIMEGSGQMIVTAVGENSQAGIIFALLSDKESKESDVGEAKEGEKTEDDAESKVSPFKQKSVLQAKLTRLTVQIGVFGLTVAGLTLIVLVVRYCVENYGVKQLRWSNSHIQNFVGFVITAVTILVVAIPEGLPLAVTIALAYSVSKMMTDNNLVRHLHACETMGSATAICSDKTGTLTTNRMTTVQAFVCDHYYTEVAECSRLPAETRRLLSDAISCNSSYTTKITPSEKPGALPEQIGNKTECALLGFVQVLGHDFAKVREQFPEENFTKLFTFNSVRKSMSTVVPLRDDSGSGFRLFSKGASEIILNKCQWLVADKGEINKLTVTERDQIVKNVIEPMASNGLRTMCVAYRDFRPRSPAKSKPLNAAFSVNVQVYEGNSPDWDDEDAIVSQLTCLGIMGIEDPVRPEVPEAIRACQRAGITVRMVTGDNILTAKSIALKCGIISPGDKYLVIEGKEFNKAIRDTAEGPVNQDKFDLLWPQLRVLARSSPEDKYVLVKGMIASTVNPTREVVAVTGDGTNDGPALKIADVGFAMGIAGTDVAKEASDIILLDDNFTSIVKAVMWGRNVYDNISKFIQFQLTVNLVAVTTAFVGACAIARSPLAAIQMLWINLVMDTLASLALATELPTTELLNRKPYGREQYIISPTMFANIALHGVYQLTVLLTIIFAGAELFDIDQNFGLEGAEGFVTDTHFTIVFNVLVLMTLFNELNARQIRRIRNVFKGLAKNRLFIGIWVGSFIVQVVFVQFGSSVLHVSALTIDQWGWCLLLGMGELIWHQIILFLPIDRLGKSQVTPEKVESVMEIPDEHQMIENEIRKSMVLWFRGAKRLTEQIDSTWSFHADSTHHVMNREASTGHVAFVDAGDAAAKAAQKEKRYQANENREPGVL